MTKYIQILIFLAIFGGGREKNGFGREIPFENFMNCPYLHVSNVLENLKLINWILLLTRMWLFAFGSKWIGDGGFLQFEEAKIWWI